jgi:quercetin dioxygenase-like cupin family protein
MSSDFSVVDPAEIEQEAFPESGNRHRKLTAPLGCTEMRINMVTLNPGEATAPHSHERQEEVYVALDGGRIQVDDRDVEVPAGGIVRVGPQSVRSVHNNSETESQRWLMFGAPPVGSISDFGEYVVPEEDESEDT